MAPHLVYDDKCGFCTWFVERVLEREPAEPVGFAELSAEERSRLPEDFERCMHLLVDDAVYSCGAAAERTLALAAPGLAPLFRALRAVPGYPALRERCYRWLADRRALWGRYRSAEPPATRRG